jgi:hypothetical protein
MEINQRLEGQVRYLASWAAKSLEVDVAADGAVSATATATSSSAAGAAGAGAGDGSLFDAVAASYPEVAALAQHLCADDVDFQPLEEKSLKQLIVEVLSLRRKVEIVQTAYKASRVELRLSTKQSSNLQDRISEQQNRIETLQGKLENTVSELQTVTSSKNALTKQVEQAVEDGTRMNGLLRSSQQELKAKDREVEELTTQLWSSAEQVEAASAARSALSSTCNNRIRDYGIKTTEYINEVKAELQREREVLLAHVAETAQMGMEVQVAASEETQRELNYVRDELFKARRTETQKDREIAYLQRQLMEASKRIAALAVDDAGVIQLQRRTGTAADS